MDPLSISASVTALLGLTTAIIQALVDIKDADKEKHRLEREVSSLLTFLLTLRSNITDAEHDQPWFDGYRNLGQPGGVLDQMHRDIEELKNLIQPPGGGKIKAISGRVIWQFEKGSAYQLIDRINRLKSDIDLALGRDQFTLSLQTNHNVQILKDVQTEQECSQIQQWLSPLDFNTHHLEIAAERTAETGTWFLKSDLFHQWESNDSGSKVLFCPGIPGAGKTILASTVIDHLKSRGNSSKPILFLYCDYKSSSIQTKANLFGALLRQLCNGSVPPVIRELYRHHQGKGTNPSFADLENALIAVLRSCFLVIDGIDEATEDVRYEILSFIHRLHWEGQASVMITSRPLDALSQDFVIVETLCDRCDQDIWGPLYHCETCMAGDFDMCPACFQNKQHCYDPNHRLQRRATVIEKHISAESADVQRFIKHRIQHEPRLRRCVQKQPKLEDRIIATVNEHFHGMFLPAKLLIDVLKVKASPAAISKALDTIPTGSLNNMYESVLERIRQQGQDDWELSMQVILWNVFAYRPLTISEVQHALATLDSTSFDPDGIIDADLLINVCAGLVDITDGCLHLVHKTAHEYFETARVQLFPDAESVIAQTCLNYLLLDDFDVGPYMDDEALLDRLENFPFYSYAAGFWGEHFAAAKSTKHLEDLALDFLNDKPKLDAATRVMVLDNKDSHSGMTSLHMASLFGLEMIIEKLLESDGNININAKDSMLNTPLKFAVKRGSAKAVSLLLENGADANIYDSHGITPLIEAVHNSQVEVVAALLNSQGIDVNYMNPGWYASNALMVACTKGNAEIVRLLLQRPELQYNCRNEHGRTGLWLAAYSGHTTTVKALLAQPGIDIEAPTNATNQSPLHIVSMGGHLEIIIALLDAGANIDCRDKSMGTPLLRACDSGHTEVVKLLIERGADINSRDHFNRTILHGAAINGHDKIVQVLLEAGIDPNVKADANETPLSDCISKKSPAHMRAAKILVEFGATATEEEKNALADAPTGDDDLLQMYQKFKLLSSSSSENETFGKLNQYNSNTTVVTTSISRRETPPPPYIA